MDILGFFLVIGFFYLIWKGIKLTIGNFIMEKVKQKSYHRMQEKQAYDNQLLFNELSLALSKRLYQYYHQQNNKHVVPLSPDEISIPQPYIPYSEYQDYLRSIKWRIKATARLEIDEYTCQYCGSEILSMIGAEHTPNVHHFHYRTLKHENIYTDLVSLCKHCHIELHRMYTLSEMEFHITQKINQSKS